jgi:hypothetical protein
VEYKNVNAKGNTYQMRAAQQQLASYVRELGGATTGGVYYYNPLDAPLKDPKLDLGSPFGLGSKSTSGGWAKPFKDFEPVMKSGFSGIPILPDETGPGGGDVADWIDQY